MHVYDSTLTRLAADFAGNVVLGSGTAVRQTVQELRWSTLADAAPTGRDVHGLLVDYGLDGDSLRFGLRFVTLVPDSAPGTFYWTAPDTVLDLHHGALAPALFSTWSTSYQVDPSDTGVYFSRVRIRHKAGQAFVPADPLTDAQRDLMAWEDEVLAMYTQNASGHPDSTMYLVVRAIARPDADGALRHHTCYHLRLRPDSGTGYRDLLNNAWGRSAPFLMHGCDFGNLCPPECATYTEPAQ